MNGWALLDELIRDLEAGRKPPPRVRDWLVKGKRRWERESATSLENALGLVRTEDARTFRDVALAEAARLMPAGWSTSERVRQVRKIERGLEPYLSDLAAPTFRNRPPWYALIFEAMRFAPLPGGDRQLHKLCTPGQECKKPGGECELSKHEDREWT